MELRSNQIKPVQLGINFFNQKKTVPSIIVAPTAFGKSHVIAKIVDGINDKVLVLQPTKELLEQNIQKYWALGGNASIYSASFNTKIISEVTYATIGSIKSIGARFKHLGFTKLIIDEVHLFPRTMESMLGGFLKDSGINHVLGLTATPLKLQTNTDVEGNSFSKLVMLTSRSKHGNFFKEIIYVSQVQEMVELNFWAKLEYQQYYIDEGKLVFNSTKADYTEDSLRAVYATNDISTKIIAKIDELKDRKSILVFVPSVAEAITLSGQIPNSFAVYGDMDSKQRDFAIKGFKDLSIRVVINVNVLSVGFDHPKLDTIICARMTASLSWFYQALGRGTRIAEGKNDCLIVDFSGNVKRFGRVEKLQIVKENIWKVYGEGGKLLTGVPMHEIGYHTTSTEAIAIKSKLEEEKALAIKMSQPLVWEWGKHKGLPIEKLPRTYIDWVLKEFTWSPKNNYIKRALENQITIENQRRFGHTV